MGSEKDDPSARWGKQTNKQAIHELVAWPWVLYPMQLLRSHKVKFYHK